MLPASFTNSETQIDVLKPEKIEGVGKNDREVSIENLKLNPEKPFEFAAIRSVDFTEEDGQWLKFSGGWLWRLRIQAPGAKSISLLFSKIIVPRDSQLWVYSLDASSIQGPFILRGRSSGHLKTPVVLGDDVTVELFIPQEILGLEEVRISLNRVNPAFFDLFGDDSALPLHYCHIDVNCEEGTLYSDQIRSVVLIELDGYKVGTGTLLNNAKHDGLPYIITANHLGIDKYNDDKVNFYWNHQSSRCGLRFGSASENTSGSTFLAGSRDSDFCLLRADSIPDPEFNVYYSGWDATGKVVTDVTSIHHPLGQVKAIKSSRGPIRSTKLLKDESDTNGEFWRVPGWKNGANEDFSSGSGLWSSHKKLFIGQNYGGFSTCEDKTEPDWYGKFSESYKKISYWLDPDSKNINTLGGFDPEKRTKTYHKLKGAKVLESEKALFAHVHLIKKAHLNELNGLNKEKIKPFQKEIKDGKILQEISVSEEGAKEMARKMKENFRGPKVLTLLPDSKSPKNYLATEESLNIDFSESPDKLSEELDSFLI
ncbi:MAG: hypothetical protein AAF149_20455 [Bacteroidota bacterium]